MWLAERVERLERLSVASPNKQHSRLLAYAVNNEPQPALKDERQHLKKTWCAQTMRA